MAQWTVRTVQDFAQRLLDAAWIWIQRPVFPSEGAVMSELDYDDVGSLVHKDCGGMVYQSNVDGSWNCLNCGASWFEGDLEEE